MEAQLGGYTVHRDERVMAHYTAGVLCLFFKRGVLADLTEWNWILLVYLA